MSENSSGTQSRHDSTLRLSRVLTYACPVLMLSFASTLANAYYVKYGTDILLVAPATMTAIYGFSRLWEACCDPLVGYWSDRTRSPLGRRRSWILVATPPLCLFALMMWSPPSSLADHRLTMWLVVGAFGFATALSAFSIPHGALGAEISPKSQDRTRLFATNGLMGALASAGALTLGIHVLRTAETPRSSAMVLFGGIAVGLTLLAGFMVARSREPERHQGRGAQSSLRAYGDVLRNPHARILIAAGLFINITYGAMSTVATYMLQYVMKRPDLTEVFMASYFVPTLLCVPLWVRLSQRFEKRHLWMVCLFGSSIIYGAMSLVPEGVTPWIALPLGGLMGVWGGGFFVFEPSIRAEVIDYDEYLTGERKEGVYSAASQIVGKAAGAAVTVAVGVALDWSGYVPNVEQTESAKWMIRFLFGMLPAFCFAVALLMVFNLKLTRREYARIRQVLDDRSRDA